MPKKPRSQHHNIRANLDCFVFIFEMCGADMMKEAIKQKCIECGGKFTTFDDRIKICPDCYVIILGEWRTEGTVK